MADDGSYYTQHTNKRYVYVNSSMLEDQEFNNNLKNIYENHKEDEIYLVIDGEMLIDKNNRNTIKKNWRFIC